jgi:hypothetical protein
MRRSTTPLQALAAALLFLVLALVMGRTGLAQGRDIEPNNSCFKPQNLGAIGLPYTLAGRIGTINDAPGIDYFRIVATPGSTLEITLRGASSGSGTLEDPWLGFFDSSCNMFAENDNAEGNDARLRVRVPDDGVVIVAATTCCYYWYSGSALGTYRLEVAEYPAVRSIGGQLVGAVSGKPVQGGHVTLFRCTDASCEEWLGEVWGTPDGRFRFDRDYAGQPLPPGTYQIAVDAEQFQSFRTERFQASAGQDLDLGAIKLEPNPLRISGVQPCMTILEGGGACRFAVRFTNQSAAPVHASAWSVVDAWGTGGLVDSTRFQTGTPVAFTVQPQQSYTVWFQFNVPASVGNSANICPNVLAGDRDGAFYYDILARLDGAFCITKQAEPTLAGKQSTSVFTIIPHDKARSLLRGPGRGTRGVHAPR